MTAPLPASDAVSDADPGGPAVVTSAEPVAPPRPEAQIADTGTGGPPVTGDTSVRPGRMHRAMDACTGVIGAILGLAPHILHHIGLLAGTALVAGSGGTALFGTLGLVFSVPLLLRLRRKFHSWWAPAIGLGVFTAMFALSAFVIGPAISGVNDNAIPSAPAGVDHNSHH